MEDILYIQIDEFFSLGISDKFKDKEGSSVQNIIFVSPDDAYEWLFQNNHWETAYNLALKRVNIKIDNNISKLIEKNNSWFDNK